jgi:hypothetical protein
MTDRALQQHAAQQLAGDRHFAVQLAAREGSRRPPQIHATLQPSAFRQILAPVISCANFGAGK